MTIEINPTTDDDELQALLKAVARPESMSSRLVRELQTVDLPLAHEDAAAVRAAIAAAASSPHGEPALGDVLDQRYQLTKCLGRGGMGVVFAAQNLRTGKQVAIKWMNISAHHESPHGTVSRQRFMREARAAASIRHPNVVDVYDVGGSDEAPYLVMELLQGESLRTRLLRGALGWDEAVSLLCAVLRGVAAAHAVGIVHRDLKPDNIFLCTDGSDPSAAATPKVLDFGVASMRDTENGEELGSLTRTGSVLGTPNYMPLEQLKGERVDARADIYALGVVFFELLTQKLPFSARGASELAVRQATEQPVPLSTYLPSVRGAREAAAMRALARRPGDRYADAAAFATALATAQTRAPVARFVWLGAALVALAGAGTWQLLRMSEHDASTARPASADEVTSRAATPAPKAARQAQQAVEARSVASPELIRDLPSAAPPAPALPERTPSARPTRTKRTAPALPASEPTKLIRKPTDLGAEDF